MALHLPCAGCQDGDHSKHDGRGTAPPGMLGGAACMCQGQCALAPDCEHCNDSGSVLVDTCFREDGTAWGAMALQCWCAAGRAAHDAGVAALAARHRAELEELVRPEVIDAIEAAEDAAFLYGGLAKTGRQLLEMSDDEVAKFRAAIEPFKADLRRMSAEGD